MRGFIESLSVVIVLYKMQLDDSIAFQSILAAKGDQSSLTLFVYDNSPTPQKVKQYNGIEVQYHHDQYNSGVSKAYNTAAQYGADKKKDWLLILDQDTKLPSNILLAYQKAIESHRQIKLFAPVLHLTDGKIFSPCRYKFKRGFHLKEITKGLHSLHKIAPVNSGMLINITSFFAVGGYNNEVKLDFSDFQFIERFRKAQTHFCVIDAECEQDFSDNEGSQASQANRFKYYCEGALNSTKTGFWDWIQYNNVVLVRAIMLTLRHRTKDFLVLYVHYFLMKIPLTKR